MAMSGLLAHLFKSRSPSASPQRAAGSPGEKRNEHDPDFYPSDPEKQHKLAEYEPDSKPKSHGDGERCSTEERFYEGKGREDGSLVAAGDKVGKRFDTEEEEYDVIDFIPEVPERRSKYPDLPTSPLPPINRGSKPDLFRTVSTRSELEETIQFVEQPSDDYQCPICVQVVRKPYMTDCCSARFCKRCLFKWKQQKKPCPLCQEEFHCIPDKRLHREIMEMRIHCRHHLEGCQWVGAYNDLKYHLKSECELEFFPCSNGCGENVLRKQLLNHLQNACPLRQVQCDFCPFMGVHKELVSHLKCCYRVPLLCPNDCCLDTIERQCMDRHLATCPLQEIDCDFKHVGCPVQVRRIDLRQHIQENLSFHVVKMAEKLRELRRLHLCLRESLQSRQSEEKRLVSRIESLKQVVPVVPFDFTQEQYHRNKYHGGVQMSPPFYSHYRGYKLFVKLYLKGRDPGKAHFTYISLFIKTLRGEYDDELHWPVHARVAVQVLDPDNPGGEPWCPQPAVETVNLFRVTQGHVMGGQEGWKIFIRPTDSERFVKEEQLHFRVSAIEIIKGQKP